LIKYLFLGVCFRRAW